MTEVWLRPNRRVLILAMLPLAILHVISIVIYRGDGQWMPNWLGIIGIGITAGLLLGLIREVLKPRIAYQEGHVLFNLKSGSPIAVPLHVVEAFFQGESKAHLPGKNRHQAKSVNLIARLSQRETDWQRRDIKPALGQWKEGYITVHGTWCEPIDTDVIRRLNRRITELTRERQANVEAEVDA